MMAYIDENGNITDTPIDPKVRKAISADSIEIGIPKREDIPNDGKRIGKVAFFNSSKGYGFISYDSFESSDLAIECMNGQFLCNRPIVVQYAFKKETPGERHG